VTRLPGIGIIPLVEMVFAPTEITGFTIYAIISGTRVKQKTATIITRHGIILKQARIDH
jgi:hypothetical protein